MPEGVRPYLEAAPIAAFFLGISSGFGFAMIAATLTTRLAQSGLRKADVTLFAFTFLAFNFKFLWAPLIDNVRIPVLGRFGQRRAWLWLVGTLVLLAVMYLGTVDPSTSLVTVAWAAILVGVLAATNDIIIDAYRIEILAPHQLGVGSGMNQYGWRIGSAGAAALALVVSDVANWSVAYYTCALFALPAMVVGLVMGEPARRQPPRVAAGPLQALIAYFSPLAEFIRREGAITVLLFVLIHKIGDTLANLTLRLLLNDQGYTNTEIATYDVQVGFVAFLVGIFVGGALFSSLGMKSSVMISLILMAVSNFSFAALAAVGHSNLGLAATIAFENFASGIGGVTVVAYMSALCNLRFTATQYALLSALASIAGRVLTGATAGSLIEAMGYFNFYVLTTVLAFPGVLLFWYMMRSGLADLSLGTAARQGERPAT